MATGNSNISLGTVIYDAAQVVGDEGFRKAGGRPFYVGAAQRGVSKMMKDTMMDHRTWSVPINGNAIITLPEGLEEIDQVYVEGGDGCNVGITRKVYIKENMHRLAGNGYIAGDKWDNGGDLLQHSHGWSEQPPPNLLFAGRWQGQLHLSDSCLVWARLRVDYQGLGIERMGEEFEVPYWMRDAITDYVTMRAAQKLMRLDRQFMTGIFRDMKYEMERGSWLTAMGYAKRMDRKQRRDTAIYLETFAPSS